MDNHAQISGCAFIPTTNPAHHHGLFASVISRAVTTVALYPHLPVMPALPPLFFQRIMVLPSLYI